MAMTINYNLTGAQRKTLVTALTEILATESKYLGAPSFAYQVGEYHIDKTGTLTGPDNRELIATLLHPHKFVPVTTEYETPDEAGIDEAPLVTDGQPTEEAPVSEEALVTEEPTLSEDAPEAEEGPAKADEIVEEPTELETETDSISITLPLDGFTPENIDNLCKMIAAKEPLIKKALGVDAIPIKVLENGIEFPWFTADHSDNLMAYAQFITALCTTAQEKKRVTAKPQETFENERFAMRVWLIGLGLVGQEYGQIRKLMTKQLSGNGSWRYGAPDKTKDVASEPQAAEDAMDLPNNVAEEVPTDEAPIDDEGIKTADAESEATDEE